MNSELTVYRRHLPHWRLDGSVYFVTWSLNKGQSDLLPAERDLIQRVLLHFNVARYIIIAYVVMNDHVHVLVLLSEGWQLEKIIQSWKRHSSAEMLRQFGRTAPVWKREYMDRIVRDEKEFLEKANYILTNPVRRWTEAVEYRWVGFEQEG
jgi:REP element-mobilizing transposase RayT